MTKAEALAEFKLNCDSLDLADHETNQLTGLYEAALDRLDMATELLESVPRTVGEMGRDGKYWFIDRNAFLARK